MYQMLLSPIALSFVLGIIAKVIKSEFSIPKDIYQALAIYLLFAIGIKGGVELSHTTFSEFYLPAIVTLLLGVITPLSSYLILRRLGKFSISDSSAIAAHYGSVSAVTFIAAQEFVKSMGYPAEGFMPTLVTFLESPGIQISLAIGVFQLGKSQRQSAQPVLDGRASTIIVDSLEEKDNGKNWKSSLHHILTSQSMILLIGGLLIGWISGKEGFAPIAPFFESGFKGALCIFLLEMGLAAGERLSDLKKTGPFLLAFGIMVPILHGLIGVALGHWAGLSVGGSTVLGTMAASASYIAAPPAARMALPEANPSYFLTLALGVTFPFNLLLGISIYYKFALYLAS